MEEVEFDSGRIGLNFLIAIATFGIGITMLFVAFRTCHLAGIAALEPRMIITCSSMHFDDETFAEFIIGSNRFQRITGKHELIRDALKIEIRNIERTIARDVVVEIKLDSPFAIHRIKCIGLKPIFFNKVPPFNETYISFSKLEYGESVSIYLWYCYKLEERDNEQESFLNASVDCPFQKRAISNENKSAVKLHY